MTVERIEEEMLGSAADIRRFSRWRRNARGSSPAGAADEKENAGDGANGDRNGTDRRERRGSSPPLRRIVVLDTDTRGVGDAGRPNVGGGGACLLGLLRKFDAAGFAGELCWLVGGFNGFAKAADAAGGVAAARLIDRSPLASAPSASAAPDAAASPAVAALQRSDSKGGRRASAPGHMRLPSSAPDGDTGSLSASPAGQTRKGSLVQPRGLPAEAFTAHSLSGAWASGGQTSRNVRDSTSHAQGASEPPPSAQAVS